MRLLKLQRGTHTQQGAANADPAWLITMADLASLMLVFFVMLFAMTELDQKELERVLGTSIVEPLNDNASQSVVTDQALPRRDAGEGRDPDYLSSVIRAKFESDPLLRDLEVVGYGDRAVITIPLTRLAQALNPAESNQEGLLYALGGALQTLPNRIVVDANLMKESARGDRETWARALKVAHRVATGLQSTGIADPIAARGHVKATTRQAGVDIVIFASGVAVDGAALP